MNPGCAATVIVTIMSNSIILPPLVLRNLHLSVDHVHRLLSGIMAAHMLNLSEPPLADFMLNFRSTHKLQRARKRLYALNRPRSRNFSS